MSKAYSTKALPRGTILREWSLEEVLGVGGFGIVYKGRGIYFNELVAIKEYFPSSISERNEDDTVVPVDSDSEEVHALGLKKFVEEAKLLWNLSTPTRHPNIVNVRSLFEVHGTAYMVMDFEDGVSLSKMLKKGQRFNEASLSALVRPIAEGLDRAHRVGVCIGISNRQTSSSTTTASPCSSTLDRRGSNPPMPRAPRSRSILRLMWRSSST